MRSLPDGAAGALAVGWATIELDRAASELSHLLEAGSGFRDAPASVILGARCRVGPAASDPDLRIVILEPATEGRLAATLARSGEGWAATWAEDQGRAAQGSTRTPALSAARPGPFGDERLELDGPLAGPHRLIVDAVPSPP
jgi:hypothetical protein